MANRTIFIETEKKLQELRALLDEYIDRQLPSLFFEFTDEIDYAMRGGKRLRGLLTIYIGEIFRANLNDTLKLAFAIELMHSASLIHDDIVDNSPTRRGRESFWKKYGIGDAVSLPHIMISEAVKIITIAGVKAVIDSMDAWRRAAIGQIWDTRILNNQSVEKSYMEIIEYKTGSVFEAAAFLPLYLVGKNDMIDKAKIFGRTLGVVYQIIDDLGDIISGAKSDSGSVISLMKESRGDYLEYSLSLLEEKMSLLAKVAKEFDRRIVDFTVFTLMAFLNEIGGQLKDTVTSIMERAGLFARH
ncbi:MAG: hypothetical protein DRJ35_03195 [Thermoprotei archaeon]|nr:MAG: hypothetical protein DRJ35_03195 [Thermoprotei archaeon]